MRLRLKALIQDDRIAFEVAKLGRQAADLLRKSASQNKIRGLLFRRHEIASVYLCLLGFLAAVSDVQACSPPLGWTLPTVMSAYEKANVVIHVRVLSKRKVSPDGPYGRLLYGTYAKVEVLKVFKGIFTRDEVFTTPGSSCGVGTFKIGADYVFFLDSQHSKVALFDQPGNVTPDQILNELSSRGLDPNSVVDSSSQ